MSSGSSSEWASCSRPRERVEGRLDIVHRARRGPVWRWPLVIGSEKTLYGKKTTGVIRSTVLIDPAGKVAHHWRTVRAKGHAAKVQETLEAMQQEA